MGLFRKNEDEQEKRPVNPTNMVFIRLLAIGYMLYCLYQMFTAYISGSEDAPELWLLIVATVVFVGGSVWIGIITWRQFKRLREEQQAAWDEEDRLEEEAKRLAAEEAGSEEELEEESQEATEEDFEEEPQEAAEEELD